MNASDIPFKEGHYRECFTLGDLLNRVRPAERACWEDLPRPMESGVYVLIWPFRQKPRFNRTAGAARCARVCDPHELANRWESIRHRGRTDILYVGKGHNLRKRISTLVRFGAGKSSTHVGGEWVWQIAQIASVKILIQSSLPGKQTGFENWILDVFCNDHETWPFANRRGPVGPERWHP